MTDINVETKSESLDKIGALLQRAHFFGMF